MLSCSQRGALAIAFAAVCVSASAHELWVTTGFRSHHTGNNGLYNEHNSGLGAEWRFARDWQLNAGHYKNSMSRGSSYLQAAWMPLELALPAQARLRGGASVGAVNGYPAVKDGGWFPTLVPTLALEWQRIGLNLVYIPSIGKRVDGAIALQLKVRAI